MKKRFKAHGKNALGVFSEGFTLVELLVIAPIVILVIGTLVAAIVTVTGDSMAQMSRDMLTYDLNKTADQIRTDMKITNSFLAASYTNPDNTVFNSATGGVNGVLILKTYTTTTDPNESDMNFVYSNSPNSCSSSGVSQNVPKYANVIYFVKNGNLWRRTLLDATASCSTPWQQLSCADVTSNTACKTTDQEMIDNVTDFSISYYSYLSGGSDISTADTAIISITSNNTTAGATVTKTLSFRTTIAN